MFLGAMDEGCSTALLGWSLARLQAAIRSDASRESSCMHPLRAAAGSAEASDFRPAAAKGRATEACSCFLWAPAAGGVLTFASAHSEDATSAAILRDKALAMATADAISELHSAS